jgi:tetratricopeptide (TPR) repeat protein
MLVARPGELIKREEIQQELWSSGTFVDFENGLNSAVNRLRDALGDSADEPKFIETIPRRGYRFLVPVERLNGISKEGIAVNVEPQAGRTNQWLWITSVSAAALLLVAAFIGWRFYPSSKTALNFNARDWVLISSFENRTGEPVLDGTLEYALERELSNSQFANVVSRERVGDVLRLMRKPPDTKIGADLGREICLRDGGIRALLTGRVEKLGTTYVLSAELVDPVRGVAVASISEEDPAESQLAAAVRRLSNRVRETLGEKTAQIQQSEKSLEKVTTPSLHALQLYTKADELMRAPADNQAAAAELLKQALAEDPNFASAHLLLGYTFLNRGEPAKGRPEFQRAFDLADSTPDRERFFILGSYYDGGVKKDAPKAIEAYEALLRLYPDHFWAANNLTGLYLQVGRWDDSWRLSVRLADLRPDAQNFNEVAACRKFVEKNPDGAKPYMERARAASAAADPEGRSSVELLPFFYSWSEGNVTRAHEQLTQLDRAWIGSRFFEYVALGEIAEAEKEVRPGDNRRAFFLGVAAYLRGDLGAARNWFGSDPDLLNPNCTDCTWVVLMMRSGLWDKLESGIRKSPFDSPGKQILRGERAITHGQTKEGGHSAGKGNRSHA